MPYTDAKLALYAVSSSSNASVANAGVLAVIGIGEIYGLRLIKPLPGFEKYNHSLTLGADYKNFKEDLRQIGSDSILTPISYLPFMVEYSGSVFEKSWQASMTLGLNFAVRGLVSDSNRLGKNPQTGKIVIQGEFETKRAFAKPNYA